MPCSSSISSSRWANDRNPLRPRIRFDDKKAIAKKFSKFHRAPPDAKIVRGFVEFLPEFVVGFGASGETNDGYCWRQLAIGGKVVSAGINFRWVRSPVAPKMTIAHGCGTARACSNLRATDLASGFIFVMSTDTKISQIFAELGRAKDFALQSPCRSDMARSARFTALRMNSAHGAICVHSLHRIMHR